MTMRCRRTVSCVVLGLLTLLPTLAAAAPPRRSIVFILDCSKDMATPMPSDAGIHEVAETTGHSRFDVARDALKATLTELAAEGDHQVALWLFGHRLTWGGEDRSALVEQTDYLEQTLGFKVLADLLPGDDVELARPLVPLKPADLEPIFVRLDAARPWGESPLYLAIERALESLNRQASAADTSLVVLTDGVNQQWIGKQPSKKDRVVAAAERWPVPVHLVALGRADKPRRQSEAELRQIAATTRGSYSRAETAASLAEGIAAALQGQPHRVAGERHGDETRPAADARIQSAAAPSAAAVSSLHTVEGTVTFGGRAVRRAKVTIEGSTSSQEVTDRAGKFTIEMLPPGNYKLVIEAVVKNVIRKWTRTFTIDATDDPTIAVEIVLESV